MTEASSVMAAAIKRWLVVAALALAMQACGDDGESAPPCEYMGHVFDEGESVPAGDGCNECICFEHEVVCTDVACLPDAGTP